MYKLQDNGALFFNNNINQQFQASNQIKNINQYNTNFQNLATQTNDLYQQNNHFKLSLNLPNFQQSQLNYTNTSLLLANVLFIINEFRVLENKVRI